MNGLQAKGLSFYICFGKYGGFSCINDKVSVRVVMGFISIGVFKNDIEETLSNCLERISELKDN
jgi:hypothetical protein